jgi:uncharacterized GH25 family protein
MFIRIAIGALLLPALIGLPAGAHSPYLLPNAFDVSERDHVSVQASFTEKFFVPDVVMKATNWHVVSPDGKSTALTPVYTKDLTVLDVDTVQPGTYRISTGVRDGRIAKGVISGDEWKFLRPNDTPPAGAKVYEIKSITLAEVYVSRGTPSDAALAPTNGGLEFQMLTHPAKLLSGTKARAKVLFNGKPVNGGTVTLRRAVTDVGDAPAEIIAKSGADGVVELPLAGPGIYHAQLRHRFVVPGEGALAESHTYALTFDVGE